MPFSLPPPPRKAQLVCIFPAPLPMTKRRAALFLSTLVMAGLAGLIATTIYRWSGPLCGNTPIVEEPAPGGKFRAVVFERDCGATTGFSTNISIIPARSPLPNEQGNVFRADHPTTPAGPVIRTRLPVGATRFKVARTVLIATEFQILATLAREPGRQPAQGGDPGPAAVEVIDQVRAQLNRLHDTTSTSLVSPGAPGPGVISPEPRGTRVVSTKMSRAGPGSPRRRSGTLSAMCETTSMPFS